MYYTSAVLFIQEQAQLIYVLECDRNSRSCHWMRTCYEEWKDVNIRLIMRPTYAIALCSGDVCPFLVFQPAAFTRMYHQARLLDHDSYTEAKLGVIYSFLAFNVELRRTPKIFIYETVWRLFDQSSSQMGSFTSHNVVKIIQPVLEKHLYILQTYRLYLVFEKN